MVYFLFILSTCGREIQSGGQVCFLSVKMIKKGINVNIEPANMINMGEQAPIDQHNEQPHLLPISSTLSMYLITEGQG